MRSQLYLFAAFYCGRTDRVTFMIMSRVRPVAYSSNDIMPVVVLLRSLPQNIWTQSTIKGTWLDMLDALNPGF